MYGGPLMKFLNLNLFHSRIFMFRVAEVASAQP